MTTEQIVLLGMARDNAEIAGAALLTEMPGVARNHLRRALEQIDQAEAAEIKHGAPEVTRPTTETIEA